jgi:glycosyltransferase involved in cell wall biosynthesis
MVLGVAYKPNIDDVRESPGIEVIEKLSRLGAKVAYNDPHVPRTPKMRRHDLGLSSVALDPESLQKYDCVIIITNHDTYDWAMIAENAKLIVDTRNAMAGIKSDRSGHIVREFGDRVRFEAGPNRGSNVARNRLVELSRGKWLSFLDADDYLLPEKIERQMALVARNANVDVVYSPVIEFIEKTGKMYPLLVEDDDLFANYIRWDRFSTIALLWKKSAIQEVGGWNENQPVCQEHELLLRLIVAGKEFELLREPLSVYRKAGDSSISRRSPIKTLTHQMALLNKFEDFLVTSGKMQDKYRRALAQARFQAARTAYAHEQGFAKGLIRQIYQTNNSFYPRGDAAPLLYRVAFEMLGFKIAEDIAAAVRKVRSGIR